MSDKLLIAAINLSIIALIAVAITLGAALFTVWHGVCR